jgi:threonine dehydrogenase-like Zn-dependent dehydrogenase
MTERMKHWYVTGPERIELVDEPMPEPGPGETQVRVTHTAISPGSNVHVYRTGTYKPVWDGERAEAVYMAAGVIDAVGAGVDPNRVGERVVVNGVGHQAYGVVRADRAIPIPDGCSSREASLAYLASWSVSALHLGDYAAAETVVVIGIGMVGASAALVADLMGARVLALDADPQRAAFANGLGLGGVVQVGAADAATRIAAFLGTAGPDLIIETSGAWQGLRQAIGLARDHTRIAVMGIYRDPPPADLGVKMFGELFGFPSKFHYQRLRIIGCGSDPDAIVEPMPRMATKARNFAYVLEQTARGRLPLAKLVTATLLPEQIGAALAQMAAGDRSQMGVVFEWE